MTREINATALLNFEVAADGAKLRMHVKDSDGNLAALSLPTDCLNQLILTLPRMATMALKAKYSDDSLRLVFPVGNWRIELAGDGATRILTLVTPDGFEASFAFGRRQLVDFAVALDGCDRLGIARKTALN